MNWFNGVMWINVSFGFNILDEDLEELAYGGYRWRINEIDLHEISVVTFPAYENTSVQARSKEIEQIQTRKLQEKRNALIKKSGGIINNVKAIENNEST